MIRNIAYGYTITNGNLVVDKHEAEIVRGIFTDYVKGLTLAEIAQQLTNNKVEFLSGRHDWNKNRICRILENQKYTGESQHPAIITEELFNKAKEIKMHKSVKKVSTSPFIDELKNKMVCSQCGKRMYRKPMWKTREKWMCTNGCKVEKYIDDKTIIKALLEVTNDVNQNIDLLKVLGKDEPSVTPEIIKYNNELARIFNSQNPSFAVGKKIIFERALLKFNECKENNFAYTDQVASAIKESITNNVIDETFIKKSIKNIFVLKEGRLLIKFINDAEVLSK